MSIPNLNFPLIFKPLSPEGPLLNSSSKHFSGLGLDTDTTSGREVVLTRSSYDRLAVGDWRSNGFEGMNALQTSTAPSTAGSISSELDIFPQVLAQY